MVALYLLYQERRRTLMKKIATPTPEPELKHDKPKAKYQVPQVRGTTGKVSMSGAGCPTHTVQWQQVSCKC